MSAKQFKGLVYRLFALLVVAGFVAASTFAVGIVPAAAADLAQDGSCPYGQRPDGTPFTGVSGESYPGKNGSEWLCSTYAGWVNLRPEKVTPAEQASEQTSVWSAPSQSQAVSGNSSSYTVQRGDNLFRIAAKYGVTVDDLKRANGLSGNTIAVGQAIAIPWGGWSGSATSAGAAQGAVRQIAGSAAAATLAIETSVALWQAGGAYDICRSQVINNSLWEASLDLILGGNRVQAKIERTCNNLPGGPMNNQSNSQGSSPAPGPTPQPSQAKDPMISGQSASDWAEKAKPYVDQMRNDPKCTHLEIEDGMLRLNKSLLGTIQLTSRYVIDAPSYLTWVRMVAQILEISAP